MKCDKKKYFHVTPEHLTSGSLMQQSTKVQISQLLKPDRPTNGGEMERKIRTAALSTEQKLENVFVCAKTPNQ